MLRCMVGFRSRFRDGANISGGAHGRAHGICSVRHHDSRAYVPREHCP